MSYTFDENTVSDLHKDARGFRPRGYFWTEWKQATSEQKQSIWDDLIDELNMALEQEKREQESAVASFEESIRLNMELGARDRATAIRWMVQSLDLSEVDYMYGGKLICYNLGLPFNMANEFDDICHDMLSNFQREAA